ncbi:MAG: CsbD family protein [Chloroflexi bacterium]|nr:CsbD family protein [Chloroflexota bacterium]
MTEDILKGRWKQLRGEIRKQWGRLTDDDIDALEGESDRLLGVLQERYGYSRQRAEEELSRFLRGSDESREASR